MTEAFTVPQLALHSWLKSFKRSKQIERRSIPRLYRVLNPNIYMRHLTKTKSGGGGQIPQN